MPLPDCYDFWGQWLRQTCFGNGRSWLCSQGHPIEQLTEAIRRVHAGLKVIDPALAQETIFTPDNPLTAREREVTRHVLVGTDTRQIAGHLHLSTGTVRNIVSSLIAKTGTGNRFEAATMARARGWI